MENRFGVKDFFYFTLLLVLIGLGILTMVQIDRQWKTIGELKDLSNQHTKDLVRIQRAMDEAPPVAATPPATPPTTVATGGVGSASVPGPTTVGTNPTTTAATAVVRADPFKLMKEAEKAPGFARGDWLVDNFGTKLKAITPFIGADVYASFVQQRVQESLLFRDVDTLEFVPLLSKSWQISPDGLTITFQLRRGVSFSDGEPLTADDVVFTFDWIRNPAVNAARERSGLDKLVSVTKLDDYQVSFKFSEYYFLSLGVVGGQPILAKHFYSRYTPEKFNETPGLLIGTGAYRMSDPAGWKPGQRMELVRNERYWGEPPAPDKMVFLEVEEEAAEQTIFTNGEIDIFGATAEQYVRLKEDASFMSKAVPYEYNSMMGGYTYVAWNQRDSKNQPTRFADKRVRQALTMLIDREQIAKDIFLGYATVAAGPFGFKSKQADPSVKPWPFDAEAAKKTLTSLGYTDRDGDGIIDGPDGKPFKFKLTYPSKSGVYDRVTLFIKDAFAKAGILMERDPVEWPLLQQKLDRRDFDAISLGWSGSVEDDVYQMFHSSQINDQGDNRMSYSNPELDKAITDARTCVDEAKRNELWHKVHRIVADDCPYTFLLNRKATVFYSKRIGNVRLSTMGVNRNLLDVGPMPWFIYADQRKYSK